jgi:RimJ/RimL family protein N-acetyltransferase
MLIHNPAPAALLRYEPLLEAHLPELAAVLRHPAVYEHIGGEVPSLDEFVLGLSRAIAGPPPHLAGETWLNYLVRDAATGEMLGRLEATIHDNIAEVAYLFGPAHWGKGYAVQALAWLHGEIARVSGVTEYWAAVLPANSRSQALLRRLGYVEVPVPAAPQLFSYDDGDLVFRHESTTKELLT